MADNNVDIYDKSETYKDIIKPLLSNLKKICEIEDIPFFTCFAIKNTEDSTFYEYDGILTGSKNIHLKNDLLKKHLCLANGFEVIPKGAAIDLETSIEIEGYLDDMDTSLEPEMNSETIFKDTTVSDDIQKPQKETEYNEKDNSLPDIDDEDFFESIML